MADFREKLRNIRIEKGLNQEQLADMVGLTQGAISQFEKGQRMPTPANLAVLAEKLEVTPEFLMGEEAGVEIDRVKLMRSIHELSPEQVKQYQSVLDLIKNNSK